MLRNFTSFGKFTIEEYFTKCSFDYSLVNGYFNYSLVNGYFNYNLVNGYFIA